MSAREPAVAVFDELAPIYERLDLLIAAAGGVLPGDGVPPAADPYRGLYSPAEDVSRLLLRTAGEPTFDGALPEVWPPLAGSRLAALKTLFALDDFELDLLLVALAPEIDLKYERLFAALQDDPLRRRPTVDLALDLLCRSRADKLARRRHLEAESVLLRSGLLRLLVDTNTVDPPLLAHALHADPQVLRWLLHQDRLDPRLAGFCSLDPPLPSIAGLDCAHIAELAERFRDCRSPSRLHLHGPAGVGKREAAQHAANMAGRPLLIADLGLALEVGIELPLLLPTLFREALLRGAVLLLDGVDALEDPGRRPWRRALIERVAAHRGVVVATTRSGAIDSGSQFDWQGLAFRLPDHAARHAAWRAVAAEQGGTLDVDGLDSLAGRFRLSARGIRDAARATRSRGAAVQAADFAAAVRAQSGGELGGIARKIESTQFWTDLMLPDDALAQLQELCAQVRQRHRVLGDWGFADKLGRGRGIAALFAGGSGTGKTMAAGIIARELGLDLYRVDLSQVVNKYIGETEKNLERVFTAAEAAQAILFFDEADTLFGKRSEVKDAHDRYANLEVGYLLQRMEDYDGLAILATNLRQNLDDAFLRRLSVIVDFPFPDEAQRLAIWQVLFPAAAPLAADVDFAALARSAALSGGHLRNIALAAAGLAAENGGEIGQDHLWAAVRREYQKLGRNWNGPA